MISAERSARRKRRQAFASLLVLVLALGFLGLQFFPAKMIGIPTEDIGTNPPARFRLDAPPEVAAILRRSCFDCHSNETRWPLYTHIAPASWLMAYDVHNARDNLNFSTWGEEDPAERRFEKEDCWEQIQAGRMPRWYYVYPFHLRTRLSNSDKALLKSWLLGNAARTTEPSQSSVHEGAPSGK